MIYPSEVQITSAPVVTHGLVIVGSSIDDNQRADAPRGTVHAFDAETGNLRWSFDPIPRDPTAPKEAFAFTTCNWIMCARSIRTRKH